MKVELKAIKFDQRMSEETNCFSANIYIDGKMAGVASNRGHGGPTMVHINDPKLCEEFEAFCKAQPPLPPSDGFDEELPMDHELYIDDLFEKTMELKDLRRLCRKTTLFRLKSRTYGAGQWSTYLVPFTPKFGEQIRRKHGDDLAEIANEKLLQGVASS